MIDHCEALCGPERIPFSGFMTCLPWALWQLSKACLLPRSPFCHPIGLFATAPIAIFIHFSHDNHAIVHAFLQWLPWHFSMTRLQNRKKGQTKWQHSTSYATIPLEGSWNRHMFCRIPIEKIWHWNQDPDWFTFKLCVKQVSSDGAHLSGWTLRKVVP